MKTVLTIIGTRPEAIKMAPILQQLDVREGIKSVVLDTGQHPPTMTQEILNLFKVSIDYQLAWERSSAGIAVLTAELLHRIPGILKEVSPDLVLVHGDTQTCLAAALAAFYDHIPLAHVEAGLRTSRYESPFPEESNRRIVGGMTTLNFAPTVQAERNLKIERVSGKIFVTGNTVVDALRWTLSQPYYPFLNTFPLGREVVLVTCHRRESWGKPLRDFCIALKELLEDHPTYFLVWPYHPNPAVSETVKEFFFHHPQVRLHSPLMYHEFVGMLNVVDLVVTDSGGVLEEAAVLGRPALVLRDVTERPEATTLPYVELVGYDFEELKKRVPKFVAKSLDAKPSDVFGDGTAGIQIVNILDRYLKGEL